MHALDGFAAAFDSGSRLSEESPIILAAAAGSHDAFAMLFRRYRPRIFALARQYFAPGSDLDDLIQEATIGFFKAIRDFRDDRGAFYAFVELCVRRQVITFIKTATRQKHVALNRATSLDAPAFEGSDETLASRIAAPITDSLEGDGEIHAFLGELRNRCSDLERSVLRLYANGYSFEEMARELGVHWKSIDNAVWRVKVKAKKLLFIMPVTPR